MEGLRLFDDYSRRDPTEALVDAVRATAYHYDEATRSVYVLRAKDVAQLYADDRLWSKRPRDPRLDTVPHEHRPVQERLKQFTSLWPIFLEGGYHERVRRELLGGLRHVVTPDLSRRLDSWVADLLDGRQDQRFDWIAEFASPLVAFGIGALLDAGHDDVNHLIQWASAIIHELSTPLIDYNRAADALAAVDQLQGWLRSQVDAPRTPLFVGLARIWADPEAGPVAATAVLAQVITGGLDPVVSTLGVLAKLVTSDLLGNTEPALLREEVIRLAAPFRFTTRYARCPVEVGGYQVAERGRILLGLATANLDTDGVSEKSTAHFSFGQGRHYCLGATYTRAVVRAVIAYLSRCGVVFRAEVEDREPELTVLRFRRLIGRLERTV